MQPGYFTLVERQQYEIPRIQGSRFLGVACPVENTEAIQEELLRLRREHHAAHHQVYAWRLGAGRRLFRSNDDGEPAGSGGRPLLDRLDARELSDTLLVVVRYFGGVKLGVGGLSRAYGLAAEEVLTRATVRFAALTRRFLVEHPYEYSQAIAAWMRALALEPVAASYEAQVSLSFDVPLAQVSHFLEQLRERTAGRIEAREIH